MPPRLTYNSKLFKVTQLTSMPVLTIQQYSRSINHIARNYMTLTHYIKILISLFIGAPLLLPVFAMAQLNTADINANVNANAEVRTNAGAGTTLSATTTARIEKARTRAAQEIDRRIEALTKINVRIGGVTKISDP